MTYKVDKGDRKAFSIIYVEISGHELCTVWRRSKLKNKIWHSGHNRHIALLKRTQKQVKIGYSVYIYKTTRIHSETILAVSPEIYNTEPDGPPFCKFVPVINDVMLLWTTTVLSDKLDISLRPSKSTGQTRLDILRDVLCKLISLSYDLFCSFYKLEPKLVNVTN